MASTSAEDMRKIANLMESAMIGRLSEDEDGDNINDMEPNTPTGIVWPASQQNPGNVTREAEIEDYLSPDVIGYVKALTVDAKNKGATEAARVGMSMFNQLKNNTPTVKAFQTNDILYFDLNGKNYGLYVVTKRKPSMRILFDPSQNDDQNDDITINHGFTDYLIDIRDAFEAIRHPNR